MERKKITMQDVKKEWMRHFPLLKPYPRCKLLMRLDIMLIGIELQTGSFSRSYRPHLCINQLWLDPQVNADFYIDYQVELKQPVKSIRRRWLRNVEIDYDRCDAMTVDEAASLTEKQFGALLKEKVYLDDIFKLNDYADKINYMLYNPAFCLGTIELMIVLAKYFDDDDLTEYVRKKVDIIFRRFRSRSVMEHYGKSKQEFKQYLFSRIGNREQIDHWTYVNSQNEKIQKLKKAHIIFDKSRFDFSDADQNLFIRGKESLKKFWYGRDHRKPWYIGVFQ